MKILQELCAYYQTETVFKLIYSQVLFIPVTALMFQSIGEAKELIKRKIDDKNQIQSYYRKILPLAAFCTILNSIFGLTLLALACTPVEHAIPYMIRNTIMLLIFLELYCLIRLEAQEAAIAHATYATFVLTMSIYAESSKHAPEIALITMFMSIIMTSGVFPSKPQSAIAHKCFGIKSVWSLKDKQESNGNSTKALVKLSEKA